MLSSPRHASIERKNHFTKKRRTIDIPKFGNSVIDKQRESMKLDLLSPKRKLENMHNY